MKRFVILLLIVLALVLTGASVFAEESLLINFSSLAADYTTGDSQTPNESKATLIDFSDKAGTGFTEEDKALMKTSLAMNNWEIELASSSKTVINQSFSMTKEVPVRDDARKFGGEKVMGIRIHFPLESYNSWALVKPPFEIPAYMQKTIVNEDGTIALDPEDTQGNKFVGYGVLKNVGEIKSVSMWVLGMNFPMGIELILKNQNNEEKALFMGYLNFDGWKEMTWINSNYIQDVRNREMERYPLYPKATPSYKLVGIRIMKDKEQEGGDFITYIKEIKMVYDKAVLTLDMDVNNEQVWGILGEREQARRTYEFNKLGEIQVLRSLERKKMHQGQTAPTTGAATTQ
ncbi:MAG: flagellar filament outer layer protein FlaA [Spirochaetota bacterium]